MDIIKSFIVSLVLLVAVMPFASAFAVTTFYWEPDKPLVVKPGESADVFFQMQNMVGSQDKTVKAAVTGGSEIAAITDQSDIYKVPAGRKDVNVNVKVSIPKTDPIGKRYTVGLVVKEIQETEGGMVEFSSSIGSNIPVYVGSTQSPAENVAVPSVESSLVYYLLGGAALLAVLVSIAIYLRKRNK